MRKYKLVMWLLVMPFCALFSQQRRDTISIRVSSSAALEPVQITKFEGESPDFSAGVGSSDEDPTISVRITATAPNGMFGGRVDFASYFNSHTGSSLLGEDDDLLSAPAVNENAYLWVQPMPWIRVDVGKFGINTLRGRIGSTDFSRYLGPSKSRDDTFQRFSGMGGGTLLSLTPTENLYIGVLLNMNTRMSYDSFRGNYENSDVGTIYRNGQYALAYTFPGIGQLAVQYIGGEAELRPHSTTSSHPRYSMRIYNPFELENPMSLQAAFFLTAVKNLQLELGFLYPLYASEDDIQLQRPYKVALGAEYIYGDFTISGRTDFSFMGHQKLELALAGGDIGLAELLNNFTVTARLTPSYNFGIATLGMDFLTYYDAGTEYDLDDLRDPYDDDRLQLGMALWGQKRFNPGSIKFGVAIALPTKWYIPSSSVNPDRVPNKTLKGPLVVTVPVLVSFSL